MGSWYQQFDDNGNEWANTQGSAATNVKGLVGPATVGESVDKIAAATFQTVREVPKSLASAAASGANLVEKGLGGAATITDELSGTDPNDPNSLTSIHYDLWEPTVGMMRDTTAIDPSAPTAAKVTHGVGNMIGSLLLGGGNPALLVGSQTMDGADSASEAGTSGAAAGAIGAVQGTAAAVGVKVPAGLGGSLWKRVVSGVGINTGIVVTQTGAQKGIALLDGSRDAAKQYDPLDPTTLGVGAVMGGVFGAASHYYARGEMPLAERDALAHAETQQNATELAPHPIDTPQSALAHTDNLAGAIQSLIDAKPVQTKPAPPLPANAQAVADQAQTMGIDPALAMTVAHIETGGSFDTAAQNPNSSGHGLFQVLNGTWKRLGGGDRNDPAEQIRVGLLNLQNVKTALTAALGREPSAYEYYMGHLLGETGAAKVITADPNAPLINVVRNYNPKNAADIVKNNGMDNMTVGQAIEKWKAKTDKLMNHYGDQAAPAPMRDIQPTPMADTSTTPQPRTFDQFLEHTGRESPVDNAGQPTFTDGSAYPSENIMQFFDQHVAPTTPKDGAIMPNVIFRLGQVEPNIAAGLHEFLPNYHDGLDEVRISGQSLKHIYDSRPTIATDVINRLQQGVLAGDEVLPNPKNPSRALVVLNDVPNGSGKSKHGVSVLEISANGRGTDVVSSMTAPPKYLNEARAKAEEIRSSRSEVRRSPHPQLPETLASQAHPAADFPKLERDSSTNIPPDQIASNPKSGRAYTSGNAPIDFQYDLVPASELVTSHNNDLTVNDAFPHELQPRDRTRASSVEQINELTNNLNPQRLGESATVTDGAPVIGADNVVESGNARTIAVRRAYESGKADAYRQYLLDHADQFGLSRADIEAMQNPVLVRRRTTDVNRAAFARDANASTVAAMSSSERASSDAQRLPDASLLQTNADGSLNIAGSTEYINKFIQAMPESERAMMRDAAGNLSQEGKRRIESAMVQHAYGDSKLVERLSESLDDNSKNILAALLRNAPALSQLKDLVEQGGRFANTIAEDLAQAAAKYSDIRASGQRIDDYLAQGQLIDDGLTAGAREALQVFGENARSSKKIGDYIQSKIDSIEHQGDPRQFDLFGDTPQQVAAADLLKQGDVQLPTGLLDENGEPITMTAAEIRAQLDQDRADMIEQTKANEAAVSCAMQRGES